MPTGCTHASRPTDEFDPIGDIEELIEAGSDGGELMGFYCRGHVKRFEFAQACNEKTGAARFYDIRHVEGEQVHHTWWRTVPIAGDPGMHQFVPAAPSSRGAYKVTVFEGVQRRRMRGLHDIFAADRSGYRRGFSEGVSWAERTLLNSYPDARDFLIAAMRAHQRPKLDAEAPNVDLHRGA